jgi:hypothetical protein
MVAAGRESRQASGDVVMQEVQPGPDRTAVVERSGLSPVVRRLAPYIVMIVVATVAVAWTDLRPQSSHLVWRSVAVLYAAIAIWRVWALGGPNRWRSTGVQLLHWLVFLLAMFIVEVPVVFDALNDISKGILLLLLLGLATFLDGLYVDWRFCIIGALLGIGVVAVAFFNQAAVAITVAGLVALAVLFAFRHVRQHFQPGVQP